jgi:hypothetical protein
MNFPKIFISADNAEEYIKHFIAYKTLYEKIVDNEENLETYTEENIEDLLATLAVNNFNVKGLHTLIFLDDSANSKLLKSGSYISSLLSENRQPRLTFFINIQFWKGISTSIKPNINLLFIFGTFSKQQVNYILQQIPLETPFEIFFDMYTCLKLRDKVIINCDTGEYKVCECKNYIN